MHSKKPFDT